MASSPYGPGTNCVRWFFVVCNFVFMALGVITTGIGIWGLVVGSDGNYDVITGNNTISAAAVLLTAGVVTLAIATLGICGACGMWRPILIIYIVAVVLVIILEVTAAILAFVYRNNITSQVRSNMRGAIEGYRVYKNDSGYKEDTNNAVNNVQEVFECCGLDGSSDWCEYNPNAVNQNNGIPPGQCTCDLSNSKCARFPACGDAQGNTNGYNAWKHGCISLLEQNLRTVMLVIGVVGIVFAVIEMLLMVLAISLYCCIRSSQKH